MDDVALLTTGKNFEEVHGKLRSFMECEGRANDWSHTHNSYFSIDKFALLNCLACAKGLRPALLLSDGSHIAPSDHHRFLGVLIDHQLKFKEHVVMALAKGMCLVGLLHCLARTQYGVKATLLRWLYLAVMVLSVLYAADTFLTPVCKLPGGSIHHRSIGPIKALARIQHEAVQIITGALKGTLRAAIEAHADLLPFPLLIDKVCHQAAVQLCLLPRSHPLTPHVLYAGRHFVKCHRSTLHELLHTYAAHLSHTNTKCN